MSRVSGARHKNDHPFTRFSLSVNSRPTALLQLTAAGTCTALLFMRTSGAASAASDTAAAAADDDDDERRRRRRHKHTHPTCMAWRFRCVTPNHRFDDGGGGFDADRLAHEDALECGIISVQ